MSIEPERILVIRLGALGDLILCFQAFHEIRAAHPEAEIALLTMPTFASFAQMMPWFNRVLIDDRAALSDVMAWQKLYRQIKQFNLTRVIDLQGKLRQTLLYALLGGPMGPVWSGAAPFCALPRPWPPEAGMHFTDFVAAQLRAAQIPSQPAVTLDWLSAPIPKLDLPENYVIFIPSCGPGRDYKRWPAPHYAALARKLELKNYASVAIGSKADAPVLASLKHRHPGIISLCGLTTLPQLATIMRRAKAIVGNDTGPTHLAAALGLPTLALFSGQVNPVWSAPKGAQAEWLQAPELAQLPVDKVLLALQGLLDRNV